MQHSNQKKRARKSKQINIILKTSKTENLTLKTIQLQILAWISMIPPKSHNLRICEDLQKKLIFYVLL